ncbi:MAG TPA: hypothetical protein P5205_03870 [Candidatus Paceibacterota bacterium]|nr:hypothetical protein [Verrucomicrobiota bacterium]HSA09487.1 hypothetical protein [Candidatus Paceibacterota bacterium]
MNNYKSYRHLPPLAGVCSMAEAGKSGLSVEECVRRLKRYHYAFKRLHQIFTARLTAEPIYELKMAFSLHAHLCAEHAAALRKRVGEMREPPLGLEAVPDPNLEVFFDELLGAPTTEELVIGLYEMAIPAVKAALERHLQDTNPLADHPTVRLCRFALLELSDMLNYGAQTIAALVDAPCRRRLADWRSLLDDCLGAAGGLDGAETPRPASIQRRHSARPYRYDRVPRRDERFPDPYNMGVNAEVFLYDEGFPPEDKVLMLFYKRLREVDVPEMMASIITETTGQPFEYYRDLTRQLWDEARHAMMGEVGFADLGIDWPAKVMINHTWSFALNTQLKPIERHAVLYFIEQGLMPRQGKRFEWEVGLASHNRLAGLFQDYDWADEVLHARIGRDWYLKGFANPQEGVRYGDECWSRVLLNWENWRQQGLTQHRNWWPDLYREACRRRGVEPDPKVLAYSVSYQTVRADLKELTGSA